MWRGVLRPAAGRLHSCTWPAVQLFEACCTPSIPHPQVCGVPLPAEIEQHVCVNDCERFDPLPPSQYAAHRDQCCSKCGQRRFCERGSRLAPRKRFWHFGLPRALRHLFYNPAFTKHRGTARDVPGDIYKSELARRIDAQVRGGACGVWSAGGDNAAGGFPAGLQLVHACPHTCLAGSPDIPYLPSAPPPPGSTHPRQHPQVTPPGGESFVFNAANSLIELCCDAGQMFSFRQHSTTVIGGRCGSRHAWCSGSCRFLGRAHPYTHVVARAAERQSVLLGMTTACQCARPAPQERRRAHHRAQQARLRAAARPHPRPPRAQGHGALPAVAA